MQWNTPYLRAIFIPLLCFTCPFLEVTSTEPLNTTNIKVFSTWEMNISHKLICMHTKSYIKIMLVLFYFRLSKCHIYSCTCNLNLSPLCIQPVYCGRQTVREKMWSCSPRSRYLHAWKCIMTIVLKFSKLLWGFSTISHVLIIILHF